MSLIDWSDPEEMLGLLADYVADELLAARGDRAEFLRELSSALNAIADLPDEDVIDALRDLVESQPSEFAGDDVIVHVNDCIAELERITRGSSTPGATPRA